MTQVVPNSVPIVGGVVIMQYGDLPHVAYIKALETDGILVSEANYHHCQFDTRLIRWDDPHIVGFFHMEGETGT